MFARLVQATAKPGKKDEVRTILENEVTPLLQKQPGFVDAVGLTGDLNPQEGAMLTFWKTKNDAETFYKTPAFTKLLDRMKPLFEQMDIHTFTVEASTFHKIAAGKAA